MQQPQNTKDELRGPHLSTMVLDDSTDPPLFSIDTNHNERQEEISFSFTGIDTTTGGDVDVIAPSLARVEVEKSPTIQNSQPVCNWRRICWHISQDTQV